MAVVSAFPHGTYDDEWNVIDFEHTRKYTLLEVYAKFGCSKDFVQKIDAQHVFRAGFAVAVLRFFVFEKIWSCRYCVDVVFLGVLSGQILGPPSVSGYAQYFVTCPILSGRW